MRVGIVDIGSNTIKVLIAEKSGDKLRTLGQKSLEARLGGDHLDGRPWLIKEKREAAISAIQELLTFATTHAPEQLLLVGTSALREAANQEVFVRELNESSGQQLRILSEYEEAKFIGAGIALDPGIPDAENFTAFDLGGGSLEQITYRKGQLEKAQSFQLGAVRLTRSLCSHNGTSPLSEEERQVIKQQVLSTLPQGDAAPLLIGSGGAFTVSRAILLSRLPGNEKLTTQELFLQPEYKQIPIEVLRELALELQSLALEERLKVPHLPAGRADIFPVALAIVLAISEQYHAQAWLQSFYNLRFGLAASLLSGEFHEL
jgi:exopolyphosphatase/guanosine-5'-triphosphate,3'-diphosphate pyrophosphatase